jgi:predicted NAD/FAD-dependent oxidoreductase
MSTRREDTLRFDHGAQYFTVRSPDFQREVDAWIAAGLAARWAPRLAEATAGVTTRHASAHPRFVGVPRMSAPTRALAAGLDVTFSTRVTSLTWIEGAWRLRAEADSGETTDLGRFDAVLLSVPPEQAVALLGEAPALREAVMPVTSNPCWAVMAAFPAPLAADFDGAFLHEAPVAWAARNNSKPGRPEQEAWVLHATGEWTRAHADARPDAVCDLLLDAFFSATGIQPQKPVFVKAHRWFLAQAEEPLSTGALFEAERRLGVCGDWCHGCRIEGAALSGFEAARRMLEAAS